MPTLEQEMTLHAPIERCFDLIRSVNVQMDCAKREVAIAGTLDGLMSLNDTVTWQATHLGVKQTLSTQLVAWDPPYYFKDVIVQGIFKTLEHEYFLREAQDEDGQPVTHIRDVFYFESPLGVLGQLANIIVVTRHMRGFLTQRNAYIQQVAKGDLWKQYLPVTAKKN